MTPLHDLSTHLTKAGLYQPTLVIDEHALNDNISLLTKTLPANFETRLVVKSLPCLALIDHIRTRTHCRRFMCFHAPFLTHIATHYPQSDILLGKPLPASAFRALLEWYQGTKNADLTQVQWLIDSTERLSDYEQIAKSHKVVIRVSLEINVGLNRGGFTNDEDFIRAIYHINQSKHLRYSGLMGYEAHAAKMPSLLGGLAGALHKSTLRYGHFKALAESKITNDSVCDSELGLVYNTGGSTTFTEYGTTSVCNELSLGSVLLKPSDFDLDHLRHFKPACFIATPLLKHIGSPVLPGPSLISDALRRTKVIPDSAGFIYGGNWLATPCFPESMKPISLYGHSSNQELYGFDKACRIKENDIVLFRPKQSEAVLLQFGDIALYRDGTINHYWPVLPQTFASAEASDSI